MSITEHIQPILDRMLPAALMAGMLLLATGACAADHLEPEPSPLWGGPLYDADLTKSVFAEAFNGDVAARVLVMASRFPAYMVGVKTEGGAYRIFTLHSDGEVYPVSHDNVPEPFAVSGPDGSATIIAPKQSTPKFAVERCEEAVDLALGQRLVALWRRMLMETRYADPPSGAPDGGLFVFSMETGSLAMSGQYSGGRPPGKLGALIDVVYAMNDYCGTKNKDLAARLSLQVSNLEKQLQ